MDRAGWARFGVGLFAATVGAAAAVGWITESPELLQAGPRLAPLQPNSAVAFLLIGFAILVRWPVAAATSAALVVVVAGLTLAQYVLGIELGIDRLVIDPFIETQSTHAGRMAPTSAAAHLAVGLALLVDVRGGPRAWLWDTLLGTTVALLALHGMLLHALADTGQLGWGELTRMSLITVPCHLVLGGWLALRHASVLRSVTPSPRLPLAALTAAVILTITGWQALIAGRGAWTQHVLESTANTTVDVFESELLERVSDLERMAASPAGGVPPGGVPQGWAAEAAAMIREYPAMLAVGWLDADGALRWSRVRRDVEAEVADDLARAAPPVGRQAYMVGDYIAIGAPLGDEGHLVLIIEGAALLRTTLPAELRSDFATTLHLNREQIGRHATTKEDQHVIVRQFSFGGATWAVHLAPEPTWMDQVRSSVPEVLLVFGLALGLAIATGIYAGEETSLRSQQLAAANEELERRVAERTEQLRLTNEELERSNRELEQFAGIASHDLKEPLSTASLHLQMLRRRASLEGEEAAWVDKSIASLRRMAQMVDALLTLARIESAPAPVSVDPRAVLQDVLGGLEVRIADTGAEVIVPPAMPRVLADPPQLAHVLQNLVGNALKFHGEGPPRVEVSACRTHDHVRFEVRDEGIGIDPANFPLVFDMFRRVHADQPGAGMGLAVSKRIVERLGGQIGVQSAPGAGATFWFTLPSVGT